ncbi:hypothetical protein [Phocaeicola sp.]
MKIRIFLLLFIAALSFQDALAQKKRLMLFDNYTKGTVLMKNRARVNAELNFDATNNNMMFKQGSEEMILTNVNQIDTVYIGNRKFIPIKNIYLESVSTKHGDIYIHWNMKNAYKGKKGAMGMTTQAKVETINTAEYQYGVYENQYVDVYQLSNENEYYLFKKGKPAIVKNEKTLLKSFPENKDAIKGYIKEQKVSFSKVDDIIKLLEYCLGL